MATINNKQSITTTADQADIFVLSEAGTRLINSGNLTTTGTQASPIDITADAVTVQNNGNLTASGPDSPVILAGHRDDPVDGVTVQNYGTILNNAAFVDLNGNGAIDVDEYFPDGIDYYGTNGRIENYGTISVPTRDGAAIGLLASDTTVVNNGEIRANIVGIIVDSFGGGHDRNTVVNGGLINVTGGTFGYGIQVLSNDNTVLNNGNIVAQGSNYIGILLQGTGNHGANSGTISTSGANSTGVYLYGEDHSFTNNGTIQSSGSGSAAVRFGGDNPVGTHTGTFTNLGTIVGENDSLLGSDGDEIVINRGIIRNHMDLGGGDDVYVAGRKSENTGVIELGAGDDLIVVEKGSGDLIFADFKAGAGTDDVLDLSDWSIGSLGELLQHATQSAFWVHIELGKTDLRLVGVNLSALHSDDFLFG